MVLCLLLVSPGFAEPYAVLVGADHAPPGRAELRYARTDALQVRDALVELGGVAPERVVTLLDPDPAEVLAAIAAVPAGTDRFVLYYSGHADGSSLYPNGRHLAIEDLKGALERLRAPLRIGVVDACRGGGWTGAKGMKPVEPFEVVQGLGAGTVYVAASTGGEDAHEVEGLGGSVFTHHWLGGLRGPADTDGDHQVTLIESFEWARVHTIHDSTVFAGRAQHPSFHYDVRGREDVVLADLRGALSAVVLSWDEGTVSVHELDSGSHIADLPADTNQARLVLPPGRYLARRRVGARIEVAPFEVRAGVPTAVVETAFTAADLPGTVALKGDVARADQQLSPGRGARSAQLRVGSRVAPDESGELDRAMILDGQLQVGLGDRLALSLPAPALAYRVGRRQGPEALLYGGYYSGGYTFGCGPVDGCFVQVEGNVGGGVDVRIPLTETLGLNTSWSAATSTRVSFTDAPKAGPAALTAGFGADLHLGRSVVLHPSGGVLQWVGDTPSTLLTIGSSLRRGITELPLVRVHMTDRMSIDLDVGLQLDLVGGELAETTTIGLTWTVPSRRATP